MANPRKISAGRVVEKIETLRTQGMDEYEFRAEASKVVYNALCEEAHSVFVERPKPKVRGFVLGS